jgi:hypothetical protein
LRATLWLKDIDRPAETEATFSKAGDKLSVNMDSLITAGKWRHEKLRLGETEIQNAFESVHTTVERLALIVDKFEV